MGGAPKTPKWDPIGFDPHNWMALLSINALPRSLFSLTNSEVVAETSKLVIQVSARKKGVRIYGVSSFSGD